MEKQILNVSNNLLSIFNKIFLKHNKIQATFVQYKTLQKRKSIKYKTCLSYKKAIEKSKNDNFCPHKIDNFFVNLQYQKNNK